MGKARNKSRKQSRKEKVVDESPRGGGDVSGKSSGSIGHVGYKRDSELGAFTYVECTKHNVRYPKGENCPECP